MPENSLSKKSKFSKTYYEDWCRCVNHYNTSEEIARNCKRDLFDSMIKEIKSIFNNHYNKEPSVKISRNGELILVEVPVHIRESLKISQSLIDDLLMPCCVRNSDNSRSIMFELYPTVTVESELESIVDILNAEVDNTS